jgi:group I intron endonuclease
MALTNLPANCDIRNVIYCITNRLTAKRYIGQTRELLWDRWRGHRNAALGAPEQSYRARTAIGKAMRKYGVDNFDLSILEICANPDDLDARECYWIATFGTMKPHGYNLSAGGNTSPRSPEVGAAISAANKGRVKTTEWRAKLSAAHKGKKLSAEHRAQISQIQTGRKHSEETKRKRSEALKGRKLGPCSPERRAAIIAGMTPEGRQRTIQALRQRKPTEETRAKLRAAWVIRKSRNNQTTNQRDLFDGGYTGS